MTSLEQKAKEILSEKLNEIQDAGLKKVLRYIISAEVSDWNEVTSRMLQWMPELVDEL